MKVDSREIYVDAEDEYIMLCLVKEDLEDHYRNAPRWFFLPREWVDYVGKSVQVNNRLRKLKELMEYNTYAAE